MNANKWHNYWDAQVDPRHAGTDRGYFERLSKEVLFHTGPLQGLNILEIGCGSGELYEHLQLDNCKYTGIDFSRSMLDRFLAIHPDVNLVCSDANEYLISCQDRFDIIFSFGVLQYLDKGKLKAFFGLQEKCIKQGGLAVHLGVPVKEMGLVFFQGKGSSELIASGKKRGRIKSFISRINNKIGNWHSIELLNNLANKYSSKAKIFGNINYLYRVNIVQYFPGQSNQ